MAEESWAGKLYSITFMHLFLFSVKGAFLIKYDYGRLSSSLQWLMLVILLWHIFSHWPSVVLWPKHSTRLPAKQFFTTKYRLPIMRLSWLCLFMISQQEKQQEERVSHQMDVKENHPRPGVMMDMTQERILFDDIHEFASVCCLYNKNWLCFMTNLRQKESLSANNNVDASFETISSALTEFIHCTKQSLKRPLITIKKRFTCTHRFSQNSTFDMWALSVTKLYLHLNSINLLLPVIFDHDKWSLLSYSQTFFMSLLLFTCKLAR